MSYFLKLTYFIFKIEGKSDRVNRSPVNGLDKKIKI